MNIMVFKCCSLRKRNVHRGSNMLNELRKKIKMQGQACRSRGREFYPGPVPYFRGDWWWNDFYGHSPPYPWFIQEGLLSVTSESMCTNYWLTACSSLPRKKCAKVNWPSRNKTSATLPELEHWLVEQCKHIGQGDICRNILCLRNRLPKCINKDWGYTGYWLIINFKW